MKGILYYKIFSSQKLLTFTLSLADTVDLYPRITDNIIQTIFCSSQGFQVVYCIKSTIVILGRAYLFCDTFVFIIVVESRYVS